MGSKPLRVLLLVIAWLCIATVGRAENIDPYNSGSRYAWGENIGWLNFRPTLGPGVTVTDNSLIGYVWGENIGWISLSCLDSGTCASVMYGVQNDGNGNLSGYAWAENAGWINFSPPGGGVTINACGEFSGYAWGENIGWISFRSDGVSPFKLITGWQSPLDNIPPVTTYSPAILPWYKTNAVFNFFATDCGQGPKEVRYRINSGQEIVTPGAAASATVTTEACNMLEYYSIDNANNVEPSRTLAVCIDKTPPVVNVSAPVDGNTYYINQGTSTSFTVADNLSGVASIVSTAPLGQLFNTSAQGSYTFSVMATDNAGNSVAVGRSYSVVYPGNTDPGATGCQYAWAENAGWINFKPSWGPGVTVTDTAMIGMAWGENIGWINLSPAGYGGVVNNGKGSLSGYAWAENAGWINFGPANGGVSIGGDGKLSGFAWGENVGWINFSAANSCVKTAWIPSADTTPPVITGTPSNITTEATSSAGAIVTYALPTATDAVGGAVPVSCIPISGSLFSMGSTTVTCTASDTAGNAAAATFFNVKVTDTIPPVITQHADVTVIAISSPTAVVNYDLPTAIDLVAGAVPVSCVPASGSTFDLGTTAVNCSATDGYDNTAHSAFNVNVSQSYTWSGFYQPVDNPPIVNAVKAGSAVPVKFSLSGNQGLAIMAAGSPDSVRIPCDSAALVDDLTETVTAGSSSLTYDATTDQYVYVWKTDKAWANTCRQLRVTLKDGSMHVASFKLAK